MGTKCAVFVTVVRVFTVVLAAVTMSIGLYSHFDSDWNKFAKNTMDGTHGKLHEVICDMVKGRADVDCPPIAMEHFYVSIIIIAFILSVSGLVTSCIVGAESVPFNIIDFIYHALFSILLLTASIMYIISARQIDILAKLDGAEPDGFSLKNDEKYAAGAFTVIQAGLYGIMALLTGIQALISKSRAPSL